jgi:hypothetical protein
MIHTGRLSKLIILIFCSTFILTACKQKSKKDLIIGNWRLLKERINEPTDSVTMDPSDPFDIPDRGTAYTFINDSLVDSRTEYYKIIRPKGRRREFQFIGTQTKYKIINDTLKIYDLTYSIWDDGRKIAKLTSDSLILVGVDGQRQVFLKHEYNIDSNPEFDQISLSTSGCYGSCPIINIIIDSNGYVLFYGEMYVSKIGFYEGQISKDKFNAIEKEFRKAKILDLKKEYSASWTDDETITTTFLKQGEIKKSIEDYGRTGPDELVWAYTSLRYLFQDIALEKIDSTKIPPYLNLHFFRFEKGDQILSLTQSESFLLWNYLRKGSLVQENFDGKYKMNFTRNYTWAPSYDELDNAYNEQSENKVKNIVTDGRYYTFILHGQQPLTIDIGFDFLTQNKKLNFRKKKEYE